MRPFIAGLIFTPALLISVFAAIHLAVGIHDVAHAFRSGTLTHFSSAIVILVMTFMSGLKARLAARAIIVSCKQ